jgi:MFS family permease
MKGELTVLMITAFVDMLGFAMIIPLLPFYATKLGASASVVGGVSRVVFPLAAGVAMDHLGLGFPFVIAGVLVLATLLLTTSMEDYAATRAPSMT